MNGENTTTGFNEGEVFAKDGVEVGVPVVGNAVIGGGEQAAAVVIVVSSNEQGNVGELTIFVVADEAVVGIGAEVREQIGSLLICLRAGAIFAEPWSIALLLLEPLANVDRDTTPGVEFIGEEQAVVAAIVLHNLALGGEG